MDWSEKSVLITGGTGSFGKKFAEMVIKERRPRRVIIFSRDELKQHEMRQRFDHEAMRYFIGDVRDADRLRRAFEDVDIVVHAAALKQVRCEYNPIEAIMTNVMGARNVIEAALDTNVERVLALSTDKAVNPINLYGATKLCAEKLFVHANAYPKRGRNLMFSNVRYGNVIGSRGSVIPVFRQQREDGQITITDKDMTRFWITLEQGVRFVISCIETMRGGEVFVPKIPSMSIMDLATAIAPEASIDFTGIRPGEKMHEVLVSADEARHTLEADDRFVVTPVHEWWKVNPDDIGTPLENGYHYTSENNTEWLTVDELRVLSGETDAD